MIFIFLGIVLAILYTLHFSIYASTVAIFGISAPIIKRVLLSAAILMPIGFIGSTLIAHRWDGTAISRFYVFFASWIGMASNLLLFIILAWAVILGGRLLGHNFSKPWVGGAALTAGILLSVWGFWNAFNPVVREVPVKIKNLPPEWQGKAAVQLSDIHLGYAFGAGFLDYVANEINRINPEIVFLTGDIFDGVGTDLSGHVAPLKKNTPPKGIFYVIGNHETYLGKEKAVKALTGIGVNILEDRIERIDGLQIAGAAYSDERSDRREASVRIENLLSRLNSEQPSIFLNHLPTHVDLAKKYGVDLQLSGHTHKGQLFPFGYITRLIFGKYHNGFTREGDFAIYTSPGTGAWGPPMRTGNRPEITVIRFLEGE
jgi:predicted MPP superfamily phosphohydrolase